MRSPVSTLRRELTKLETALGGIANLKGRPAALVVVDVNHEKIAVDEASKLGIPVVAIVDSNCNPDNIEYVIPGNDDALRAIKVVMDTLANAIAEGAAVASKKQAKEAEKEAAAQAAANNTEDKADEKPEA